MLPTIPGGHWAMRMVARGTGSERMELGEVPVPVVDDVETFNKAFPGLVLGAVNGTSIPVSTMYIGREMLWRDRGTSSEKIAEAVVAWMNGVRVSRGQKVHVHDCPFCEEQFGDKATLGSHIKENHI